MHISNGWRCMWITLTLVIVFVTGAAVFNLTNNPEQTTLQSPTPIALMTRPLELRVMTFNVQDLPIVGPHRPARMAAIGALLKRLDLDLVGIQEAFIERDRQILLAELKDSGLSYHKYFRSGSSGSGLLSISKYPITDHAFHRYTDGGKWYKIHHGDWWAGKGVGVVRLAIDDGVWVDLYNTHLQAEYDESLEYLDVRLLQMRELNGFLRQTNASKIPALIVGDLNSAQGDQAYALGESLGDLIDLTVMDTGIDHIKAAGRPGLAYRVKHTAQIDETISIEGNEIPLSDHLGYVSTVTISPSAQ